MPVYVIGHRNPDTDSICAAISYANFLSRTHIPDAVAACCGDLNPRTQFVLSRAGLFPPRLLMDVRPTLAKVCKRNVVSAREDEAFFEVYRRMQARRIHSVPVLDRDDRLVGVLTLSRLLELLLPAGRHFEKTGLKETSLDLLCRSLSGRFLHGVDTDRPEDLLVSVGAMSAGQFVRRLHAYAPEQTVIVMGDRPTIQTPTIAYGVRCMVITGGCTLSDELLEAAKAKGVSVISSPWDTATTTLLIQGAKGIGSAIDRSFTKFKEGLLVRAARKAIGPLSQHLYPVVDENGGLAGVVSKGDLANPDLDISDAVAQAVAGALKSTVMTTLKLAFPVVTLISMAVDAEDQSRLALAPLAFAPGADDLSDDHRKTLTSVAELMRARPGLTLTLCGKADAVDWPPLAERRRAAAKPLLARLERMVGVQRDAADAGPADHDALAGLADSRAAAAKEFLVDKGGIDPGRLFACRAEVEAVTAADKGPRVELLL